MNAVDFTSLLSCPASEVPEPEPVSSVPLTAEQTAWIEEVCAGRRCFLSARAGTGKTSTICAAVRTCAQRGLPLPAVIAFNKRIAEELKVKLPEGTQVQTLHSLGFATLRSFARGIKVNPSRTFEMLRKRPLRNTPAKPKRWKDTYALVGILKAYGFIPAGAPSLFRSPSLLKLTSIEDLCTQQRLFDADPEIATEVLLESLQDFLTSQTIDYTDMVYLPYALGLVPRLPASTLIDEAQDLSALDIAFLSRATSKLFPVGDPYQSLYGWRGATKDILRCLALVEFPLTCCWRCAKDIIHVAQSWVPDIVSGRKESGSVSYLDSPPNFERLPPSVCIGRTNADLIDLALPLLSKGIPVCFLGKSFAEDLISDVKEFKSSGYAGLSSEISSWVSSMGSKYPQLDFEFKNKGKILLGLLTLYQSKPALLNALSSLFSDAPRTGAWTFSTVHASKGLEFPEVYLASWDQKDYDDDETHRNLMYVAITRAKDTLKFFEPQTPEPTEPSFGETRPSSSFGSDPFLF